MNMIEEQMRAFEDVCREVKRFTMTDGDKERLRAVLPHGTATDRLVAILEAGGTLCLGPRDYDRLVKEIEAAAEFDVLRSSGMGIRVVVMGIRVVVSKFIPDGVALAMRNEETSVFGRLRARAGFGEEDLQVAASREGGA